LSIDVVVLAIHGGKPDDQAVLDDDLWALSEPHLAPLKKRRVRFPGRRPIGKRQAFAGILFVWISSIPWDMLPQELGSGCGMALKKHNLTAAR
jgi:hypothetical protein